MKTDKRGHVPTFPDFQSAWWNLTFTFHFPGINTPASLHLRAANPRRVNQAEENPSSHSDTREEDMASRVAALLLLGVVCVELVSGRTRNLWLLPLLLFPTCCNPKWVWHECLTSFSVPLQLRGCWTAASRPLQSPSQRRLFRATSFRMKEEAATSRLQCKFWGATFVPMSQINFSQQFSFLLRHSFSFFLPYVFSGWPQGATKNCVSPTRTTRSGSEIWLT